MMGLVTATPDSTISTICDTPTHGQKIHAHQVSCKQRVHQVPCVGLVSVTG